MSQSMKRPARFAVVILVVMLAAVLPAQPADPGGSFTNVVSKHIDIYSDGTRMSGDIFHLASIASDQKLPVLVLCHGWGGTRAHLNSSYARQFASAGYMVVTFDYRGWGDSDSRLVIQGDMPKPDSRGVVKVDAMAIRELVDPFDQTEDIINVLHFIQGEPNADTERIGLWGTSYGGGHVLYVAAHDPRVKCIVSQVGSMDSLGIAQNPLYQGGPERAQKELVMRARGEIDPVPQGVDLFPALRGTPYVSRMISYRPVEFAGQLKVPMLIIDAENEELFDNKDNGGKVYDIIKDKVPSKREVYPGITHYGIYGPARKQATELATKWFDEHLKASKN